MSVLAGTCVVSVLGFAPCVSCVMCLSVLDFWLVRALCKFWVLFGSSVRCASVKVWLVRALCQCPGLAHSCAVSVSGFGLPCFASVLAFGSDVRCVSFGLWIIRALC